MSSSNRMKYGKVAVFGCPNVGKTAFIVRLITKRFIGEYESGKEMIYNLRFVHEDDVIELDILDSQIEQDAVKLEENIKWADAFILMYSITDSSGLDRLYELKRQISRIRIRNAPMMLIGNKNDLEHFRAVAREAAANFAELYRCLFYEVAAAEDYGGVHAAFGSLVMEMRAEHARCAVALDRKSKLMTMKNALKQKLSKNKGDATGVKTSDVRATLEEESALLSVANASI
ncbi:PREDICTED: ras-related and estrogen-regulated growth inhibitor-like [Priapulus caudatus]|uniref:small monomeric GTPase n=1 Tax=Priapulus caudatus TaxID=37621 RepID=A0ABM1DWD5_PRICU|nr:PREDICTED: ras-related and estrogen-regulated growth inhibitor-like [Priapulus caudatus]XP_014664256.1 PREDICTED: ras-related and estrogen-regulated growth inhibitor-like [Priapulus caudatus]